MAFAIQIPRIERGPDFEKRLAAAAAAGVTDEVLRQLQHGMAKGELEEHIADAASRKPRVEKLIAAGVKAALPLEASQVPAVKAVRVEIDGHLEHDGTHQVGARVWPLP